MHWSDLPRRPTARTLRQFAGLWLLVFGGLAAWYGLHEGRQGVGWALATAALVVGPIGLIWPPAVRWVFVGWLTATAPVGWTLSRFGLVVGYHGIFTPLALWFRLIGRDALRLRWSPAAETYWQRKPVPAGRRSYFHQC